VLKDFVLKRMVVLLLPFMQVYGLYVVFHGHLSPGGGFAGGIIIGLSLICYTIVLGVEREGEGIPERILALIEGFGSYWYGAAGLLGIVQGASLLISRGADIPMGQVGNLLSGGLTLIVTLGVGVMVASTMVTLFYSLAEEEDS
jgi:multicomponent Na+:H+ antiporter subunit B